MKLIIDIPDDVYESVKSTKTIETINYDIVSLYRAIKNGTPVSTDGDLISREALKKAIEGLVVGGAEGLKNYYENGSKSDENAWIGGIYDAWELICNAPTVEYPEVIILKCDTEEDKQKLLSAFRNAKLSGKVIPDNLQGWRYEE